MTTKLRALAIGLALAPAFAAAGGAATLSESNTPGYAFGSRYDSPTEIGSGYETISGTGNGNRYDNLVFTGLPSGAQRLTFDFRAPSGYKHSYSAGASIFYDTKPFDHPWDGIRAGQVQIGYYQPHQSFDLDLDENFAGDLFLAMNFTHGRDLSYNISAPSNFVAPVPLPAGIVLIGSAIAA